MNDLTQLPLMRNSLGRLTLWDAIFAEDMHPPLHIADYVCLAMLLRIRESLLDSDCKSDFTLIEQRYDCELIVPYTLCRFYISAWPAQVPFACRWRSASLAHSPASVIFTRQYN